MDKPDQKIAPEQRKQSAAARALAEAAQRRALKKAEQAAIKEIGGPRGVEPTRFGDWERKGITSDF